MKQAIILLAMVGLSMACYTKRHQEEFEAFRRKYRKNYATQEEYTMRCLTFSDNFDEIEAHNSARNDNDYLMDVNQFSDLTNEEFVNTHMGFDESLDNGRSSRGGKFSYSASGPAIPTSYDLESLGLITEVKDQGSCGSCYSFAAIAHFESQILKIAKLSHPYFSEQMGLECTSVISCGNQKCQGGLMTNVYECLMSSKTGVEADHHYPYISYDGNNGSSCSHQPHLAEFIVVDFFTIDSDERAIQQAILLYGAIAVGMNANGLQNYKSGIYNPTVCIGFTRNHAVTICGWGVEGSKKFWIIKNSWGSGWGEAGYFRHLMGKDLCGINGMASFAILSIKY